MDYLRRKFDKAYRRIPLFSSGTPKFVDFVSPNQSIQYNDREQVLEILRDDGQTELFCGNQNRIAIFYSNHGINQIRLQCHSSIRINEITARMWVRKGSGRICYKVPPVAKCDGPFAYIMIPGGCGDMELFGDEYFRKVFDLHVQ